METIDNDSLIKISKDRLEDLDEIKVMRDLAQSTELLDNRTKKRYTLN